MMLPIHFNENRGLRSSPGERIAAQPERIYPYADLLHIALKAIDPPDLQETKVESMWFLSLVVNIALPRQ